MKLINETGQQVAYWISSPSGGSECGDIDVDGIADHPDFDNQANVYVGFKPSGTQEAFEITCANTGKGQQVQIALIAE